MGTTMAAPHPLVGSGVKAPVAPNTVMVMAIIIVTVKFRKVRWFGPFFLGERFKNVRLIEDCMMFDEATGKFHRVSKTAAFIIGHLKVQTSVPDIIEAYAFKFSIPITIAARD